MSSSLPTGFTNFPVSKTAILASVGLALGASLTSTKYIFYYAYSPFLDEYGQYWRLLTFQLAFINESEVFLAMVMLYQFRNLERLYSSHRYFSLLIVFYLHTLLFVSILVAFKFYTGATWLNAVSSGPTSILFALLAHYREYIPVMYKFEIHGPNEHKLVLTDQFFVFIVAFQLAITQGWSSISMAGLGWVIGDLVSRSVLPGKSFRVPFWKRLTSTGGNANNNALGTSSSGRDTREDTPTDMARLRQQEEEEEEAATETRPLASQFLDTFRR